MLTPLLTGVEVLAAKMRELTPAKPAAVPGRDKPPLSQLSTAANRQTWASKISSQVRKVWQSSKKLEIPSSNGKCQTSLRQSQTETRTQCKLQPAALSTILCGSGLPSQNRNRPLISTPGFTSAGRCSSHLERLEALGGTSGPRLCPGALRGACRRGGGRDLPRSSCAGPGAGVE